MKVIFLDIDGVLCIHAPDGNWGAEGDDVLSADCCRRLKEILDATGCKLVLSSSWRLFRENVRSLFAQLRPFGITRADFWAARLFWRNAARRSLPGLRAIRLSGDLSPSMTSRSTACDFLANGSF